MAQIFDDPARRRSIYDLTEVQILYRSDEEPASVYYLAGWFMHVLGAGVHLKIAKAIGPEFCSIAGVTLIGPNLNASVELVAQSAVEVTVNGEKQKVTVYPQMTEYEALRRELAISGRDAVFEDVLGLAQLMRHES